VLTHLIETQGLLGGLEPARRILSKRKWGRHCENLERKDREVRLDPDERALEVRDRYFLLLLVFKRVICTEY
jgi:hypothetical protein